MARRGVEPSWAAGRIMTLAPAESVRAPVGAGMAEPTLYEKPRAQRSRAAGPPVGARTRRSGVAMTRAASWTGGVVGVSEPVTLREPRATSRSPRAVACGALLDREVLRPVGSPPAARGTRPRRIGAVRRCRARSATRWTIARHACPAQRRAGGAAPSGGPDLGAAARRRRRQSGTKQRRRVVDADAAPGAVGTPAAVEREQPRVEQREADAARGAEEALG